MGRCRPCDATAPGRPLRALGLLSPYASLSGVADRQQGHRRPHGRRVGEPGTRHLQMAPQDPRPYGPGARRARCGRGRTARRDVVRALHHVRLAVRGAVAGRAGGAVAQHRLGGGHRQAVARRGLRRHASGVESRPDRLAAQGRPRAVDSHRPAGRVGLRHDLRHQPPGDPGRRAVVLLRRLRRHALRSGMLRQHASLAGVDAGRRCRGPAAPARMARMERHAGRGRLGEAAAGRVRPPGGAGGAGDSHHEAAADDRQGPGHQRGRRRRRGSGRDPG